MEGLIFGILRGYLIFFTIAKSVKLKTRKIKYQEGILILSTFACLS